MFNNKYPYTDFHELNLDWIINELKNHKLRIEALEEWREVIDEWKDGIDEWKAGINTWKAGIDTWKGTIDTWKGTIDTWKANIDTWKTNITGEVANIKLDINDIVDGTTEIDISNNSTISTINTNIDNIVDGNVEIDITGNETITEIQGDITDLENNKQDVLTAGDNITIENNVISATDTVYTAGTNITIEDNVISAAGGGTQVQADWDESDPTDVAFIKNKPTIPPSITVDDALSISSVNPVQNKVITSKISTVLGVPSDPSLETHNYTFANPIPFHTPTAKQKLINAFFFDNVDNKYYYIEFIFQIDDSYLSHLPLIELKFVKNSSGKISIASKYNGVQRIGPQCDVAYYLYDDTGELKSSTVFGWRMQRYIELTWSVLSNNKLPTKNLTKGNPIDSTFITSDEISDAQNVPLFNYTINGDLPKTPWEQIQEKVTALETSKQDKLNIAKLTGTCSVTDGAGETTLTYPEGFTKSNCIVLAFASHNQASQVDGQSYGVTIDSLGWVNGGTTRNVQLTANDIKVTYKHPNDASATATFTFDIYLLKL